jgi:hypothetical protein
MSVSRLIKFFTSLRLTVVLLAFAIILLFIGTLAQADEGLYQSQAQYFWSWIILSLDLFGHHVPMILPGGYLIGTLLLINLLAAHIYRFQLSVKKIGIQLAHSGIILILVGLLVTDMLAHESQIRFLEGQTTSYSESARAYELIFTTPAADHTEQVIAIPDSLLTHGGAIQDPNLPFSVQVKEYWKNSEPSFRAPMMTNGPPLAPNGVAMHFDFHPDAEAKDMDDKNVPTALIELDGASGSLGDWVVSDWTVDPEMISSLQQQYQQMAGAQMAQTIINQLTAPQSVTANGHIYTFALRPQRVPFPFSLTLLKATHTVYQGTDIPKDFRSLVRLQNPQTGEDRQVEISMNHPLRYDGLTFYQYQMDAGQAAAMAGRAPSSVLQVVHNPGWLTPYLGCALVGVGLVIQFMFHLVSFMAKKR